jgi:hypothetical protein
MRSLGGASGNVLAAAATVECLAYTLREGFAEAKALEQEMLNAPLNLEHRIQGSEWFYPDLDMSHRVTRSLRADRESWMTRWRLRQQKDRDAGRPIVKLDCILGVSLVEVE